MSIFLIIYSYITLILAGLSYIYLDLPLAEYFQNRMYDDTYWTFKQLTDSGEGFYWIVPTGIVYLFYRYFPLHWLPASGWLLKNRLEDMRVFGFVALSALLSGILVNLLKLLFARHRPEEFFQFQHFGMSWFGIGHEIGSFPSGHSATALSVGTALALLFPRWRVPVILFAIVVMFSRVVINKHYLSDILVGGYVGLLTAVFLYARYFSRERFFANKH